MIPANVYHHFRVTAEMMRWITMEGVQKKRRLYEHRHTSLTLPLMDVWTDASGYAGGSVHTLCDETGKLTTYSTTYHWSEDSSNEAINYKVSF